MSKFGETRSIGARVSRVPYRSPDNIAAMGDSEAEDPELSISRRSHGLSLSYGSLYLILH